MSAMLTTTCTFAAMARDARDAGDAKDARDAKRCRGRQGRQGCRGRRGRRGRLGHKDAGDAGNASVLRPSTAQFRKFQFFWPFFLYFHFPWTTDKKAKSRKFSGVGGGVPKPALTKPFRKHTFVNEHSREHCSGSPCGGLTERKATFVGTPMSTTVAAFQIVAG